MKMKLVGIKHMAGNSRKTGKPFDFWSACFLSDMSERDVNDHCGKGQDVHTMTIPERFVADLNENSIGKDFNVETYYNAGRENIGYVAPFVK